MKLNPFVWKSRLPQIGLLVTFTFCTGIFTAQQAYAHWCSNVYNTYARIVVKPERDTLSIGQGQSGTLKVRVRNNFPYTLAYFELQTNDPPGIVSNVVTGRIAPIYPGQEATFTIDITNNSAAPTGSVTLLNLQVHTAVMNWTDQWLSWNHEATDDDWVRDDVHLTPSVVKQKIANPDQTPCLNAAKLTDLADVPEVANCGSCEVDGMNGPTNPSLPDSGLMDLWAMVNGEGNLYNQPTQWEMRAGHHLAIRLRWDATINNPNRSSIQTAMKDVMDNSGIEIIRGAAAFFAAYGFKNGDPSTVQTAIETMASSGSTPQERRMAKAGLLIMGQSANLSAVQTCANDGNEAKEVRAACVVALGMLGTDYDQLVRDILLQTGYTGDGTNANIDWDRLLPMNLLQLLVFERRGGPKGTTPVSFLDEEVIQDNVDPQAPTNLRVQAP